AARSSVLDHTHCIQVPYRRFVHSHLVLYRTWFKAPLFVVRDPSTPQPGTIPAVLALIGVVASASTLSAFLMAVLLDIQRSFLSDLLSGFIWAHGYVYLPAYE